MNVQSAQAPYVCAAAFLLLWLSREKHEHHPAPAARRGRGPN
jgi:hypothetical protein